MHHHPKIVESNGNFIKTKSTGFSSENLNIRKTQQSWFLSSASDFNKSSFSDATVQFFYNIYEKYDKIFTLQNNEKINDYMVF